MKSIICLVTNDLTHDQRMNRICTSLTDANFDVLLLGRVRKNSVRLDHKSFKQKRVKCFFDKGPLFYIEINIRFFFKLLKLRPQIVNTIDADTLLAAYLYKIFFQFTWIHDAHELFTEVPEVVNRGFVRKIWQKVEQICLPKIDDIYTVSNSVAEHYKNVSKKSVEVIRNLPEQRSIDVVKPKSKNSTEVILIYQGALNEGRCIDMYIKAMHHIDAVLWIVGEGDLSTSLREITEREKLQQKVIFKGWVKPDDLRQLTESAYIGLNVLEKKGLSYYYSLSNKSLDYIQAGLPSINSDFPEYRALHNKYGVFAFANPNVDSIVSSVNLLLYNRIVYDTLRENCIIAAQNLVWATEKEKLLAIYEKTR